MAAHADTPASESTTSSTVSSTASSKTAADTAAPASGSKTAAASLTLPEVQVQDSSALLDAGRLALDTPAATASRLGLTARQMPAAVTVIDRSAIEAASAQNTQDILRGVPGVTAHDAPGSIDMFWRGFSRASITQLFNGINLQYSIAMRPVDSWMYDRVEAIGGASSFLYGAGGVGGTVNYVTKVAERSPISEARLRLGNRALKEGSVGLNRLIAGDPATGAAHYARLDVNMKRARSHVHGVHTRARQIAASVLSDLTPQLSHTLAYEYQAEHVDRPYWGTPLRQNATGRLSIDPGTRRQNYNSADGLYAQNVQWLRSITEWRPNADFSLKNTFYAYDAQRDFRNVEIYTFNSSNSIVTRTEPLLQRHDHDLTGNRLDGTFKTTLAGRASDWAFGLDISRTRFTSYPQWSDDIVSQVNPYRFEVERFFDIPGLSPKLTPSRTNHVRTVALYLENRTALTPSLHLLTALRHDRIHLKLRNYRNISPKNPAHYSRNYQPTTGRLGLVWSASPGMSFYAQYATASDPPSGSLTTTGYSAARDNTELTTGRQLEAGMKASFWGGKADATLAAYHIVRRNISTADPAQPRQNVLIGKQSSRGLEATLSARPLPALRVSANFSYTRPRYDQFYLDGVSLAGRTPDSTPRTVANLWASYSFTPRLHASASLRHVGRTYASPANTAWWPSYTLLDLGLGYELQRGLTLDARLRNATNRAYASDLTSDMAYLGPARSFDVTLHWSF